MDKRTIILAVTIFILLIVGMFIFAYLSREEVTVTTETAAPVMMEQGPYAYLEQIDGKYFYIDGEHIVVGEISMPTPCDLVEVEAVVMESFPEQVRFDFTVINNAEVCAQVFTQQRFMVQATASPEATLSAALEGRTIRLNLIPALPGESPADFELFIKG